MTLIVAKIEEDNIQILSDTRLFDKYLGAENPLNGQLKTVILNPSTTLSYSGLLDFANDLLSEYYQGKIPNLNSLIIRCLEINRKSGDQTWFLISYLINNKPYLVKINAYNIQNNLKVAWLGHADAFSKYQEFYHSSEKSPPFDKMEDAFDKVIGKEVKDEVGDFVIRVTNENDATGKIQYLGYQVNRIKYIGPYEIETFDSNKFMIKHASAEKGGFGISYVRSFIPSRPAIGFHFHVGKFGILFFPEISRTSAILIKEATGSKFCDAIKTKYGIDVQGLVFADNGLSIQHYNTIKE
ncbi:MAG: hypothetical protein EOO46_22925 [Flavobacterium sp.]|nr:MAG: hypothetical protein EOO46_22925 [Flavobacterium sp.]